MQEANLYQKLKNKTVRCQVCQRNCLISEGKVGFCLSRLNQGGRLFTLLYGVIAGGIQIDPIEKKPFYHFKPGSLVASVGSFGCNFRCKQCLNWWSSWGEPGTKQLNFLASNYHQFKKIKPENIIKTIIKSGYLGIAFTYNEPVIWVEFAHDLARLAKKAGLYTVFVTNGSWTQRTIDYLAPFIDAANIDFKGFSEKTYQKQAAYFGQVPEMAVYAQKKGIFLEITSLIIPGVNDNPEELKKMADWIVKNLGPDTPWHFSQFDPQAAPDKKFQKIPFTRIKDLEKASEIGRSAGLKHVYIWAPDSSYSQSDTFCPKCKNFVIKRAGWQPEKIDIDFPGNCRFCGYKLKIIL